MSERVVLPSCSSLVASIPRDQRSPEPHNRDGVTQPDCTWTVQGPSSPASYALARRSTVPQALVPRRPDLAIQVPARTGFVDFAPSTTLLLTSSCSPSPAQWTPASTSSSRQSMPIRPRRAISRTPPRRPFAKRKPSKAPTTKNINEKTRRGVHGANLCDIEDILHLYLGIDAGVAQGKSNSTRCGLRRRKVDVLFSTKVILSKLLRMCIKWAIDQGRLPEFQERLRAIVYEAFESQCVDDPMFEGVECEKEEDPGNGCVFHGHPDFRACKLQRQQDIVDDMVRFYTRYVKRKQRSASRNRYQRLPQQTATIW